MAGYILGDGAAKLVVFDVSSGPSFQYLFRATDTAGNM